MGEELKERLEELYNKYWCDEYAVDLSIDNVIHRINSLKGEVPDREFYDREKATLFLLLYLKFISDENDDLLIVKEAVDNLEAVTNKILEWKEFRRNNK